MATAKVKVEAVNLRKIGKCWNITGFAGKAVHPNKISRVCKTNNWVSEVMIVYKNGKDNIKGMDKINLYCKSLIGWILDTNIVNNTAFKKFTPDKTKLCCITSGELRPNDFKISAQ